MAKIRDSTKRWISRAAVGVDEILEREATDK
jgi:hypothetical protein